MSKRILITGSNGLLGQKLVALLSEHPDFELIATSRGENRLEENSKYVYESLDIENKQQVEDIFKWYKPEVIINTAAMTNVDACELDHEACRKANVTAVENIVTVLQTLKENKKNYNPHLIHLSTDFIFDGKNGPYKEEDEPAPLSYYGECKLEAERVVMASNLKWAILRTVLVYGVTENMSRSNIVLWVKKSLEEGKEITVVDDQFRTPTLAEDLAQGCILTAEKRSEGIYNISGFDQMSILDIAYEVADFFKLDKSLIKPIKTQSLSQPAARPPKTGFVLDKAQKDLGYRPHSFKDGLSIVEKQL